MSEAIAVPGYAMKAVGRLNAQGFEAYLVGGCVRDSLLGREPNDWDVATNALPRQVMDCFAGHKVIPTGIQHGTVTVLLGGNPVEITTYRIDGDYSDHRRPDMVSFTGQLREDLARRDFTVNAMAYHPGEGLVDPFGGAADMENRLIRCVGDPAARFSEDSLRIFRAARFACVLGFAIEPATALAMEKLCPLLDKIASERIAAELNKAVTGEYFLPVFLNHSHIITQVISELAPCVGFDQHSGYHIYNVWEHSLRAMAAVPPDKVLRLAMLLHDVGKPPAFRLDDGGQGHFKGHPKISGELTEQVLKRLRYDNETVRQVVRLVELHDLDIPPEPKEVRRWLNRIGEPLFRQLLLVQRGDNLAKARERAEDQLQRINQVEAVLNEVIEKQQCYTMKDLAVGGRDLQALGIPGGPAMGRILGALLDRVIDGTLENHREALLSEVKKMHLPGALDQTQENSSKKGT